MSDGTDGPTENGRPLGELISFTPAQRPHRTPLSGTAVTLRLIDPATDAEPLFTVSHLPAGDPEVWTYLYAGPYADVGAYRSDLEEHARSADPFYYAVEVDDVAQGIVSYMAIEPAHGTIELGSIWFSPKLQRTRAATEAIFLLAENAFDVLGYRRVEWKCNALNAPSRRAAERFGFNYEGTFAQHRVVKGRNRDTAWFAMTDRDWPQVRDSFKAWLAPGNFDGDGYQLSSLRSWRDPRGAATDR